MSTNNLKKIRKSKNITQIELAKLTGIPREHISRIENGHNLTEKNIRIICKSLNVSADYLLGLVEHTEEVLHRQYTKEQIIEIKKTLQASADYLTNLIENK